MTTDPDSPEVLVSLGNEIEAAAIVTALQAEGIEAFASGGFTSGYRAEAPGCVRVLVRRQDCARAKEILAQIRTTQSNIDWSQVDVGDPES